MRDEESALQYGPLHRRAPQRPETAETQIEALEGQQREEKRRLVFPDEPGRALGLPCLTA